MPAVVELGLSSWKVGALPQWVVRSFPKFPTSAAKRSLRKEDLAVLSLVLLVGDQPLRREGSADWLHQMSLDGKSKRLSKQLAKRLNIKMKTIKYKTVKLGKIHNMLKLTKKLKY